MGRHYQKNNHELEEFLKLPGIDIIDIDKNIANRYGIIVKQLKDAGTPIPVNDIWIASAVMETGARLISYDKHFSHVEGLIIISP